MMITTKENKSGQGRVLALSAADLARMLGVSPRHVRRLDSEGRLPEPVHLGRAVRWLAEEIEAWLVAGAPDRETWQAMKGAQK